MIKLTQKVEDNNTLRYFLSFIFHCSVLELSFLHPPTFPVRLSFRKIDFFKGIKMEKILKIWTCKEHHFSMARKECTRSVL
jgi:hypothetical protein